MSKKLKSLQIHNLGQFEEVSVSINEDVTYIIGDNGSGKSYIGIEALQILFQGIAEKSGQAKYPIIGERFRFIGPNSKTASVIGVIHDSDLDCDITIHRKISKTGQEIIFEAPDGVIIDQAWLNSVFNIFMISPKHFEALSPQQQAITLGIDLSEHDIKIKNLKTEFTFFNRQVKDLGFVDLSVLYEDVITPVNIAELKEEIQRIREWNYKEQDKEDAIDKAERTIENNKITLLELKKQYEDLVKATKEFIEKTNALPKPEFKEEKELLAKYENAAELNVKAETQKTAIEKANNLKAYEKKIEANKKDQEKETIARTKTIQAKKLPYKELSIDEEGQLLLEGRFIKEPYFSTGQLSKIIPTLISSTNPDFKYVFLQGFDLLDEENQKSTLSYLLSKGYQVVIETLNKKVKSDNKIILKNCKVVDDE